MLLGVLDNLLGHDLPLEPSQSAFDRFTGINVNYCHLYLHSKDFQYPIELPIKHARPQRGQASTKRPCEG